MKKILYVTAGFHLFLLLLLVLSYRTPKKVEPEPLLVQTVQLKPPPPPPKPKPKVVKKVARKAPIQKKAAIKKKRTPSPQPKAKKILEELDQSFAKIKSTSSSLPTPKKIEIAKSKPKLKEVLMGILQRELILPEMGKVQVRLRVDQEGKISIQEFLLIESEANRNYIEKKLASITLPSFEKREDSYILTFTNRDNS
ncbi:MAG: hypothetical protein SNF33_03465 [Candidatus Algichlamydia australiensis]|nr:hypothetical protein [Chlamydiales bacterium]